MEELLNKDISYEVWKELKENSGMPVFQMSGPWEFVKWPWMQESSLQAKSRKTDVIWVTSKDDKNKIKEKIVEETASEIVKEVKKNGLFFIPFYAAAIRSYESMKSTLPEETTYGFTVIVRFADEVKFQELSND